MKSSYKKHIRVVLAWAALLFMASVGHGQSIIVQQTTQQYYYCDDGVATLQVTAETASETVYNYQWQVSTDDGSSWANVDEGSASPLYSGATTDKLKINGLQSAHRNYRYRCVVIDSENAGNSETSNEITLRCSKYMRFQGNVHQYTNQKDSAYENFANHALKPVIIDQTDTKFYICDEGYLQLYVTVSEPSEVSYRWQVRNNASSPWRVISSDMDWPKYENIATNTITIDHIKAEDVDKQYRCVVINCSGDTSISRIITLACSNVARFSGNGNVYTMGDQADAICFDNEGSAPVITDQSTIRYYYCDEGVVDLYVTVAEPTNDLRYSWQVSTDGGVIWQSIYEAMNYPDYKGYSTNHLIIDSLAAKDMSNLYRCVVSTCTGLKVYSDIMSLHCSSTARFSGNIGLFTQMEDVSNTDNFVNPDEKPNIIDQTHVRYFNCSAAGVKTQIEIYVTPEVDDPDYQYQWQVASIGGDDWTNIYNTKAIPWHQGFTTNTLRLDSATSDIMNYQYRCVITTCSKAFADTSDIITFACSQFARFQGSIWPTAVDNIQSQYIGYKIVDQSLEYVNLTEACGEEEIPPYVDLFCKATTFTDNDSLGYTWEVFVPEKNRWFNVDSTDKIGNSEYGIRFIHSHYRDTLRVNWDDNATDSYEAEYLYRCIVTDDSSDCGGELYTSEIFISKVLQVAEVTADVEACPEVDGYTVTLHTDPYVPGTLYTADGVHWQTDSVFHQDFSTVTNYKAKRSETDCAVKTKEVTTVGPPQNLYTTVSSSATEGCIIDATEEGWQHILTSDNTKIIASIKTGDVDLGNLNVEVFVDNKQQLYKDPLYTDDIGEWYMNRHFRITYSNNVNIKADQDIRIRLYFTNDEYHAFMDSTSRIEHFEDIKVYRYTNNFALPMVDGVLTNNDRSSGTWVNEEVKSRGETYTEGVLFPNELDSIHYIEFVLSGGRYSEFWLTDKDMITYTVKYLPNGNTVSGQPPVDNNKYPIYTTLTVQGNLNAPKLTRPGAVFMGWSTRQITFLVTSEYLDNIIRTNDYYGYYDAGANYKITKNTIFYAVWAVDEDENGLPDYEESPDPIYVITYNGNNSTVGTPPTDENEYTPSTSTVIVKGKGTLGRENAVFIGWSETKIESIIGTQTEYDSWAPSIYEPLDEFTITDTTEFYAVWAVDANGNGTPDYEETGHRVTYDGNGSTAGAVPTDATLHLDGVTVSVRDNTAVPALSKTKAVFIGWSFTKYNVVIATQNAEDVANYFIPGQTFTMGDHDTTLFAVWAADTNSNGLVDYKEPKFAVIYTDNIGAGSLLYTDDNYITNTTAKVLDLATKGVTVIYANHVLLGFARAAYPVITTQSAEDVIASEILSEGDELTIAGHDITLYAVWAIDLDNNGTPDYQDGVVHVTYEGNGNTSGTVPTDATDYGVGTNITLATAGTMVKTDAVLLGWTKEQHTVVISTQNAEDLLTIYAPGSTYQLNEDQLFYALWAEDLNHNGTPDYKDASYILTYDLNGAVGSTPAPSNHAGGETVTAATVSMTKAKAVFIGWSLSRYTSLVTTQDLEDLLQPLYQGGDNFTMPTRNCTMYAIWAADANENGQPDYDEGSFTVTFLAGANGRIVGTYYFNNIVAGSSWESVVDMPTTKANTGYEFDYWRDKNGNQVSSFPATITEDLVYTAIFKEIDRWNLVYDDNDADEGNVPTSHTNIERGNSTMVKGNVGTDGTDTLKRTGALFVGWSKTPYHTVLNSQIEEVMLNVYKAGDMIAEDANTTLYAIWALDRNDNGIIDYNERCPVTFHDGDHGTLAGTTVFNVYYGSYWSSVITEPTVTPASGYEFSHWVDKSGNKILTFPPTITDTLEYTAMYVPASGSSTPTVTYLGNNNTSGTAPVDANSPYAANASVTVLGNTDLARTNCIFIGWSLRQYPDALTDKTAAAAVTYSMGFYTAGNTYKITNDVVLYAVWAADANNNGIADYMEPYTVTYNGNYNTGGSVPVDANTYVEGSTATVADNTGSLVRTGAVWIGWTSSRTLGLVNSTSWANSLVLYNAGDDYTVNANTTMYAVWAIDENGNGTPDYQETYTVTFTAGANGSLSGTTNYTGIAYNTAWAESITTPTPTPAAGYKFDHWEDLDGTVVPNFPAVIKKDTAFRAIFVAVTSNLHAYYYSNGATGSAPVDETNYAGGSSLTVKGNVGPDSLTKSNSVFLGWSLVRQNTINTQAEENALTLYKGGDAFVITQDTAFYAVWAKDVNGPNGVSDGIPDYKQKKVLYNNNGGKGEVIDNNIYDCGTENIPLMTQGSMYRGENLFLGWSTCDNGGDVIATEEDLEIFKASCTLLDPETDVTSIDELLCNNRTLYAIWGDVNEFPIELFAYRSDCMEEGGVLLTWTTATETNNEYFTLLRSEDGETFTEIGRTAGAGTANTFLTYTFVDESAIGGVLYYYKLQQTDFDGKMEELQVITALCETTEAADFNLYPNPTRDQLHLELTTTASGKLQAYIYSATGLLMRQYEWEDNAGRQSHSITVSDLAPGTYYLSLKGHVNNLQPAYKIVVVR